MTAFVLKLKSKIWGRGRVKALSFASKSEMRAKMIARAAAAGPFHFALYLLIAFPILNKQVPTWGHWHLALIGFSLVLRFALLHQRAAAWSHIRDGLHWRILFGVSSLMLAVSWSSASVIILGSSGIQIDSFLLILCCLGIAAISISAFSYDLEVLLSFLQCLLSPIVIYSFLISSPGASSLGWGLLLYSLFVTFTAIHLHQAQIGLYLNYDIIKNQKESIQSNHLELKDLHQTLRMMIESVGEAFLIFNSEGYCAQTASNKAKEFFGMDPAGKGFWEILGLEGEDAVSSRSWFSLLFSKRFELEELLPLVPQRYHNLADGAIVALRYHSVFDEKRALVALVLTAKDIRAELAAQKSVELARERSELVLRIHDDKASFRTFLQEAESVALAMTVWEGSDYSSLRRNVHTLKGVAGMCGASAFAEAVHQFEKRLKPIDDQKPQMQIAQVREIGAEMRELYRNWTEQETDLLHRMGVFDEESVDIPLSELRDLEKILMNSSRSNEALGFLRQRLIAESVQHIFEDYRSQIQRCSDKLNKQVEYKIQSPGVPILLNKGAHRAVFRSFIHIFNNCLDHGIESREERQKSGKPERGLVQIIFGFCTISEESWLEILVEDDGQGIDPDKIRETLLAKGIEVDEKSSDIEVVQRIFDDGITTKTVVTSISGQGVGMGAVRSAVIKAGGQMRVAQTSPKGTQFQILLPYDGVLASPVKAA